MALNRSDRWPPNPALSARGLTTSLIPHRTGPAFQIDFDFLDHRLDIHTVVGEVRSLELVPRSAADFYETLMSLLDELDVATEIWVTPVEIPDAIPFPDDHVHASYDGDAIHRFWLALVEIERVLKQFAPDSSAKPAPSTSSGVRSISPTPASPAVQRHHTPAALRTADPKSWTRRIRTRCRAAATGLGVPPKRASSTPTPIPTRLAIATTRWTREMRGGTTTSASSSYPARSSEPGMTPKPRCSAFCSPRMKPPRPLRVRTAPLSNDHQPIEDPALAKKAVLDTMEDDIRSCELRANCWWRSPHERYIEGALSAPFHP